MIEPGFLQVQVKGVFWQAFEFSHLHFGHTPEAFNAIDMGPGSLVLRVVERDSDHTQGRPARCSRASRPAELTTEGARLERNESIRDRIVMWPCLARSLCRPGRSTRRCQTVVLP